LPIDIVSYSEDTHYLNSVYVDSNLIINCRNRKADKYNEAVMLLGSLICQNINLYISNLVIDEVWWILLRAWYQQRTGRKLNQKILKQNPSIVQYYSSLLEVVTTKILRFPNIYIVENIQNGKDFIHDVLSIFVVEQLGPRDSFHLGLTIAHNIQGFATCDEDFDNLNLPNYNLTVYKY